MCPGAVSVGGTSNSTGSLGAPALLNDFIILFIFGCAGSLPLCRLLSSCCEGGSSLLAVHLWWLLLLRSAGPWHSASVVAALGFCSTGLVSSCGELSRSAAFGTFPE